jgi:hypothetical protein
MKNIKAKFILINDGSKDNSKKNDIEYILYRDNLRDKINEMNYSIGAHTWNPIGIVKYSEKVYVNKHMSLLGLPFYISKMKNRFDRAHEMQKIGINFHYSDNIKKVTLEYYHNLSISKTFLKII